MGMQAYNPSDEFPDLDGNGGTVGTSNGTPGSGPLEMIQDGDPFDYEPHYIGAGTTAQKHGLFGKLVNAAYYMWRRWNLVQSLGGTTQYNSGNFPIGNSLAITAATGNGVSPIVCTVSSTEGMRAGSDVVISGATGNTAMNGTWRVQIVSSTQFALQGSAGNGTYNASSATAKWAWSLWQLATYLSNNAAMTNVANSFGPNQSFAGNVTVSGNVTIGGSLVEPVIAPTKYFSTPFVDQSPVFTGTTSQDWYIGDPGTPIVTGMCDDTITPLKRFSAWGSAAASPGQGLTIHMAAHVGTDSPQMTIVFDPACLPGAGPVGATLLIYDVNTATNIFQFSIPAAFTSGESNSGSVTIAWKNGVGWRVAGFSGFAGMTSFLIKW
ncbi:MAG TPA: hypothetical protein VLT47_10935 [Anaeromyxobacteraceae bacterium]|nr:hypothetical protein [Anaeromyxobacteraceae bacterium]